MAKIEEISKRKLAESFLRDENLIVAMLEELGVQKCGEELVNVVFEFMKRYISESQPTNGNRVQAAEAASTSKALAQCATGPSTKKHESKRARTNKAMADMAARVQAAKGFSINQAQAQAAESASTSKSQAQHTRTNQNGWLSYKGVQTQAASSSKTKAGCTRIGQGACGNSIRKTKAQLTEAEMLAKYKAQGAIPKNFYTKYRNLPPILSDDSE